MPEGAVTPPPASRLQRLLGFLGHDPKNLRLIADAAQAAFDEGDPACAERLLERYDAIEPLPPALVNLRGMAALDAQRYEDAKTSFEALLAASPDEPELRFNLAWTKAMLRDWRGAEALLGDAVMAASPRAPQLRIQVLHHLGRLDDALAVGGRLAERFPDNRDLMGELATVAIDAEQLSLAEAYARRAGDQHDGLATLGMLTLNDDRVDASIALFRRALAADPRNARALLGEGLGLLAKGEPADATRAIDAAAGLFETHLGSWVAAGWAYFVKGDYATSRARFETALAIDGAFAEIHGGLAVLDVAMGQLESAERRTEVALRLDRNCLSAALAKVLVLSARGDVKTAERVRDTALNTKIGASGRTIAQAMARLNLAMGKPAR
jgi:tetratricopeptide (TPR) repeat protein